MINNKILRYGKKFALLRRFFKHSLSLLFPIVKIYYKFPKVESVFDTLQKIKKDKLSIVRFGDGEILYLVDRLDLPFQKFDKRLAKVFIDILKNDYDGLLVGLPIGYSNIDTLSGEVKVFWKSQIVWNYGRFKKYLNLNKQYSNASITRLTYGFNKDYSERGFNLWKEILRGQRVLIIEGEKTRFGVGNDLLSGFKKIDRIIAPKHNAFYKCDEIIDYVTKNHGHNDLIIVALGPAAKFLVFELFKKGFRCLDVGNLDIEYEWYLRDCYKERQLIPGKYTSEVKGGREVGDHPDAEAFDQYKREIVASFL